MSSALASAPVEGFGAIGASITVPRGGNNWTEQLIRFRSFDFGQKQHPTPQFIHWADDDDVAHPQNHLLPVARDLATQIQSGSVSVVYLENSKYLADRYLQIYSGMDAETLEKLIQHFCVEIGQALDILSAAGNTKLVLGNVGNWDVTPTVRDNLYGPPQQLRHFPDHRKRCRFVEALCRVNERLLSEAADRRIPLIDLFRWSEFGRAEHTPVFIAGCTLKTHYTPTPSTVVHDGLDFFVDPQHPGPIPQGLLANMFIAAITWYGIRTATGDSVKPFGDQEILANYGVQPLDAGPTFFDISPFVIFPG